MYRLVCIVLLVPMMFRLSAGDRFQKTVTIHVNAKNDISIDGIHVYRENLAKEVQQRLWRSYMSNGKMLHSIQLQVDEGATEETRKEVLYAITTAQEKTLTVLSLHKHKKRFEDIGQQKQDKIRKQFPVLFQRDYSPVSSTSAR